MTGVQTCALPISWRGTKDRRTKRLYLTPLGVRTLARLIPLADRVIDRFFQPLAAGEREIFERLLAKLADRNGEIRPRRANGEMYGAE